MSLERSRLTILWSILPNLCLCREGRSTPFSEGLLRLWLLMMMLLVHAGQRSVSCSGPGTEDTRIKWSKFLSQNFIPAFFWGNWRQWEGRVLLYSLGWPWTKNPPIPASECLKGQACPTTTGFFAVLRVGQLEREESWQNIQWCAFKNSPCLCLLPTPYFLS